MTFSLSGVISGIRVYLTQLAMARGVTEEAAMSMSTLNLAFKANPFGLIATAIAGAVIAFDLYNQKQEQMNQKISDSIDKYKQQQTEIKGIIDSYKQNAELAKTDENAKNKLLEIETQLVSIFGESASKIDLQNGSIQDNINQIKELNRQKAESFILENQLIAQKKQQDLEAKKYGTPKITSSTSELGTTYYGLETAKPLFKTGIDAKEFKTQLETLLGEINKGEGKFKDIKPEVRLKLAEDVKGSLDNINKEISTSTQLVDSFKNAFKTATEDTIVGLDSLNSEQKKVYENLAKSLNLDINNTKDYQENLQKVVDTVHGYNGKNIDDVVVKLKELPSLANVDWTKILNVQSSKESTVEISNNIKQLTTEFDSQTDKIRDLYDIINQLNNGGLSDTSAKNIIKNYKELIPYLGNEVELRQHINSLIGKEESIQKETYANMISLDEDFYKNKILVNTELVKEIKDLYTVDLNGYKNLAEAKFNVENELIKKISEKWGSFYDVQSNAFTSQFQQFKNSVPYEVGIGVENQIKSQVQQVENAKKRFMDIALTGANFDLSKLNIPKSKDSSSGSSYQTDTTDLKESTIEKDYLADLKQRIALKESEVDINKALQETATDDAKIELLKQEITLRQELMKLSEEEADKYRTRRDELVQKLQGYNVDFTGVGEGFKGDNVKSTNAIDILNTQKDKINELVNQYNSASKEMQKSIGNELKDEKEKLQDLETAINSFYDITSSKIPDAQKKWANLNKTIGSINGDIDDIGNKQIEAQAKLNKETQEMLKKNADEKIKLYEDAENQIMEIQKKKYEKQQKEEEKALKDKIDKLEKAHKKEIDGYEDSKKDFDRYIDAEIDKLDELKDAQDFSDDIKEISDKIIEAQTERNNYILAAQSGDLEAQAKVAESDKSIKELQSQLSKKYTDKEYKDKKEALEKSKESYDQYIDDVKEAKEDDYNDTKEKLEQQLEDTKDTYERLLDELNLRIEAENLLVKGSQEDIKNLFAITGENATQAGEIIQNQLLSKLSQIKDIYTELENLKKFSEDNGVSDNDMVAVYGEGGTSKHLESVASIEKRQKARYDKAKTQAEKDKILRETENATGRKPNWSSVSYESYSSGTNSNVFNLSQDTISNILQSTIKSITPNVNIPSFANMQMAGGGGLVVNIDKVMDIHGNVDSDVDQKLKQTSDSIVDKTFKMLWNEIKKA